MNIKPPPFLSFCIPTYNNANELRATLDSILMQIGKSDHQFEIIISDNCSVDQTELICKEFCRNYSFIKYFRNEINIGPGKNIFNALKNATGDFLWLLGDDKLLPNSISKIQEGLRDCKKKPAAIYVNWLSVWPKTYKGKRGLIERETNAKVSLNQEVDSIQAYLNLRLPYLPFMSAHIFNRKLIDFNFLEEFSYSNWVQLYILFSVLSKSPHSLHIAHICIQDNHQTKLRRQVAADPWPSDIFTSRLLNAVLDQERLGFIEKKDVRRILSELYDYIYCDDVSLREYLLVSEKAKSDQKKLFDFSPYYFIGNSMRRNQNLLKRMSVFFLINLPIWHVVLKIIYFFYAIWQLIKNPYVKSKKVVIISAIGHNRILKIAKALNSQGIRPTLITQDRSYFEPQLFDHVLISSSLFHSFYLAVRHCRGSIFHIICIWNYSLAFLMIVFKIGKIFVDTYDVLNFFIKPVIIKKYALHFVLEKFCLRKADGLICRDLRTNLLKRNQWKLPPRILFMDYISAPLLKSVTKKMACNLVYLGNIEIDINSSVAYQYSLAEILSVNNIHFHIYPVNLGLAHNLKLEFMKHYPLIYKSKNLFIHNTIPAKEISKEISSYSFGLLISTKNTNFINHDTYYPIMERYFFAAKIFDYYESAVFPVIQNGTFIQFVMRRMGVGVTVNSYDEIIDLIIKYKGRDIVFDYNKKLTLEYNAPRLVSFYMST